MLLVKCVLFVVDIEWSSNVGLQGGVTWWGYRVGLQGRAPQYDVSHIPPPRLKHLH